MTKVLWHSSTISEIKEMILPQVKKNEIEVMSQYSMISLGTERLVIQKKVPESVVNYMKVPYMQGDFSLPIAYGYAVAGKLKDGTKVHVMHPHQDKCVVKPESIFTDCEDLPSRRIPLISNMETVINAIWDSKLSKEQSILITGFGNLGSLLATTLKYHYKISPKILESNTWRQQKAKDLGFELFKTGDTFDITFNTAANENALQVCIDHANEEGTIIEMSWYGDDETTIKLGGNFHKNSIKIISTQVSKIPLDKRSEFDYHKRKILAVNILKNDAFDALITNIIPFEKAPDFFNAVRRNTHGDGLIYLIKY